MSLILEKKRVSRKYDRRVKLTDTERQEIRQLYFHFKNGIRSIARIYEGKCSRRLIQFILFPERLKEMQKRNIANKHHLKYYDKTKWKGAMQNHRHYKRKLIDEGKI